MKFKQVTVNYGDHSKTVLVEDKTNKPCDGFDLAKTSKTKALLLAPLLAVCGWIILLWLVAKR